MGLLSTQLFPGMTIAVAKKIYRVESSVKVTVAKGVPFMKTRLVNLVTDEVIEKNFKTDQEIEEVTLQERPLEYLYPEGREHLFLDVNDLDEVLVGADVTGEKIDYLKEGITVKGMFYGENVVAIELPQFLELMVAEIEGEGVDQDSLTVASSRQGILETGAKIEVPLFIEPGDVIKVETEVGEYVQRI